MQFRRTIPLALASLVAAQNLTQVLNSQNETLSVLNGILATHPSLANDLGNATNITFLAPDNDAMNALLADNVTSALLSDEGYLKALLFYHTLNGTYRTGDFNDKDRFIPTYLTNESYTQLADGQRLQARRDDNNLTFISYEKSNASVVTSNINFNSGAIHIINRVLTIPRNFTDGLVDANLTAAAGAIRNANLETTLAGFSNVTIFAPNNEAFSAISNLVSGLDPANLATVLGYHVVNNSVLYSTMLRNGESVRAVDGTELKITVEDDEVYVNAARVTVPDLLVSDGVIHVINQVLNPANATEAPDTSATQAPAPAFSGATSAADGQVPFTSDIPAPSSTFPAATDVPGNAGSGNGGNGNNGGSDNNGSGASESSTSNPAMPMKTGAVGAAALFGGAALMMNL